MLIFQGVILLDRGIFGSFFSFQQKESRHFIILNKTVESKETSKTCRDNILIWQFLLHDCMCHAVSCILGDSSRDRFILKRWSSLNPLKWSLNHFKTVTKNHSRYMFICWHSSLDIFLESKYGEVFASTNNWSCCIWVYRDTFCWFQESDLQR